MLLMVAATVMAVPIVQDSAPAGLLVLARREDPAIEGPGNEQAAESLGGEATPKFSTHPDALPKELAPELKPWSSVANQYLPDLPVPSKPIIYLHDLRVPPTHALNAKVYDNSRELNK